MKRRSILVVSLLAVLGVGLLLWMATRSSPPVGAPEYVHAEATDSAQSREGTTWYTCGMHPEVVQDHPGDCPKCGMKLQPMAADRAAAMGLSKADGPVGSSGERRVLYWKSSMNPGRSTTSLARTRWGWI